MPTNYAHHYSQELAQAFPNVLNFGALYNTPNNSLYKWLNANTIQIPVVSTTGRKNANRNSITGFSQNHSNEWETKTLSNQRFWETLIHPADINQTNMALSIANITRTYNQEQKFPEMDAYTVSKIYADWIAQNKAASTTALTTINILDEFDKLMEKMDEARVPQTGRILYVTPAIKRLLKNANGVNRNVSVDDATDFINRNVSRLDEVEVVVVPSDLMKTTYNFDHGWKPGTSAKQIHMFLVHPLAVITPVNYSASSLAEPSAVTQMKYYYYEESHEDVFILNERVGAIEFIIQA